MGKMKEQWRRIWLDGALTSLAVSDLGRVRVRRSRRLKHQYPDTHGKLVVNIYSRVRKKPRHIHVSKLVAEAFLGPCPDGLMIEHLDQNDQNNHASNLTYMTQGENIQRSYDLGKQGERLKDWVNTNRYLSEESYELVRELSREGYNQCEIGRVLGLTNGMVSRIIHGITKPRENGYVLLTPDWSKLKRKRHE